MGPCRPWFTPSILDESRTPTPFQVERRSQARDGRRRGCRGACVARSGHRRHRGRDPHHDGLPRIVPPGPAPDYLAKPFQIIKFRSDAPPEITTDGPKLAGQMAASTKLGFILRKTSLDELPELWNVVKGDMSLARPGVPDHEIPACYTPEQARRHEVRPDDDGARTEYEREAHATVG